MGKIMMNGIQYGVGGIEQAKDISYDNTESGATATDVQGALDELNAGLTQIDFKQISVSTDSAGRATYTDSRITTNSIIVLNRLSSGTSSIVFSVARTNGSFTIYAYNTDTKAAMANASLNLLAAIKY